MRTFFTCSTVSHVTTTKGAWVRVRISVRVWVRVRFRVNVRVRV